MIRIMGVLLLMTVFIQTALADYHTGVEAYQNAQFSTAYSEFKTLADKGDYKAQFYMGVMLQEGQAVEKDIDAASRWFRIAAEGAMKARETNSRECQSHIASQQETINRLQEAINRVRSNIGGDSGYTPQ